MKEQTSTKGRNPNTSRTLTVYDLEGFWRHVHTCLRASGEHSSAAFASTIGLLFPGAGVDSGVPGVLDSPFEAAVLGAEFAARFAEVYEGGTTAVKLGNYSLEIPLGSVRLNPSELMATISHFPSREHHASSCWATRRDLRKADQRDSWDLYRELSLWWDKGILKPKSTSSGNLNQTGFDASRIEMIELAASRQNLQSSNNGEAPSSKQGGKVQRSQIDLNQIAQWKQTNYWMELRSLMLDHLAILARATTEPSLLTYPLILSLLSKRVTKDQGKEELDSPDGLLRHTTQKPTKARMTMKGSPDTRKSLLENFRTHMKKRFSTQNRASLIRVVEAGGLGGRTSGIIGRKSNQISMFSKKKHSKIQEPMESGSASPRKQSTVATSNFPLSRQVFVLDRNLASSSSRLQVKWHQHLNFKPIFSKASPAPILRRTNIGQSQLWIETRSMLLIERMFKLVTGFKVSVISGENPTSFGENEQDSLQVATWTNNLSKKYSMTPEKVRGHAWRNDILTRTFANETPELARPIIPLDLPSVDVDSSFGTLWTSLLHRKTYVEQLAKTEEGFPATGSYDMSRLFSPTSLILNLGILYSIKMKVNLRSHLEKS